MKASQKHVRIAPRKARLVADMIRGKSVDEALVLLQNTTRRASYFFEKLVRSAVANAAENDNIGADVSELFIKKIYVDEGPTLKRWRPRAMGRATRINKRTSHMHVELEEYQE
jgi:large subunit ribosomal protein L22